MVEQQVLSQVHAQRQAGINENEIKRILRIQGFTDIEIADALALSPTSVPDIAPAPAPAPAQNPVSLVMPHNDPSSHVLTVMPTAPTAAAREAAPEPIPVASPIAAVDSAQIVEIVPPRAGRLGVILLTVFMTLLVSCAGIGAMYAYTKKIGPFAPAPADVRS